MMLAACVRRYGDPQATVPYSVLMAIPSTELEQVQRMHLEILPVQHDVDPVPFMQLTLFGD